MNPLNGWQDPLRETILTEIQSVKQKISEAGHVQRQYRTMVDVMNNERIGYEKQLLDLEKEINDAKAEVDRLKVRIPFIYQKQPVINNILLFWLISSGSSPKYLGKDLRTNK